MLIEIDSIDSIQTLKLRFSITFNVGKYYRLMLCFNRLRTVESDLSFFVESIKWVMKRERLNRFQYSTKILSKF